MSLSRRVGDPTHVSVALVPDGRYHKHARQTALIVGAWILLAGVLNAQAGSVFNVTTNADLVDDNIGDGLCHTSANTCSLRAAVMQANALSGAGSTLIVLPSGNYVLGLGNGLHLGNASHPGRSLIIDGAGASTTIIDANQTGSIVVDSSLVALIKGLTIRNGLSNFGGGITSLGTLTLIRCTIQGNRALGDGGGIGNAGNLNVIQSTLRANTAMYGGGIANEGIARVSESLLRDNHATLDGGGIHNGGSSNGSRHLYMINSTLSANFADNNGGGIFSDFANSITFLYNTSLVGNDADDDHDQGGGVGGGIYAQTGARFVLVNALLANNTQTGFTDNDCSGVFETYGRNFFTFPTDCSSSNGGVLYSLSPASVASLQDNGGPTWSHALLGFSEAIDSAQISLGCVDETGAHLGTDQRGAPRPSVNRFCDAGAFEYGAVVPVTDLIFRNGFEGGP